MLSQEELKEINAHWALEAYLSQNNGNGIGSMILAYEVALIEYLNKEKDDHLSSQELVATARTLFLLYSLLPFEESPNVFDVKKVIMLGLAGHGYVELDNWLIKNESYFNNVKFDYSMPDYLTVLFFNKIEASFIRDLRRNKTYTSSRVINFLNFLQKEVEEWEEKIEAVEALYKREEDN